MKVLLIGSGARENALAWKLAQSPLLGKLYLWPGNPGMLEAGEFLELAPGADYEAVLHAARAKDVELIIIGPEAPLSAGVADKAKAMGFKVFGPSAAAAQLEASKAFAKSVMQAAGVPTAAHEVAIGVDDCRVKALSRLKTTGGVVLKASGLAAGKGVFVCQTEAEVAEALRHLYQTDMRQAAATVVIEELMIGRECSYFTLLGEHGTAKSLGFAVDYKRLQDNDQGPNTGGMGCYTPVPWLPTDAAVQIETQVVQPVMRELQQRGITYVGWLYVGLMWTTGGPRVVEFNVRLGDPEAQVLAVRDSGDWLADILDVLGLNKSNQRAVPGSTGVAVGVVMTSPHYPFGHDSVNHEAVIALAELRRLRPAAHLFTASVLAAAKPGDVVPAKGRVLTLVGKGDDFDAARSEAYQLVAAVRRVWPEAHCRTDIAKGL